MSGGASPFERLRAFRDHGPFARALTYFPSVRRQWLKGVACGVPQGLIDVIAIPLIVREVINGITTDTDAARMGFEQIAWWCALVLALTLVKGVFKYGMRFYITGASRDFERRFRDDFFKHLLTLQPHDIQHVRTGDIMSRSVSDLEAVRLLLGPSVMYVLNAAVVVPGAIGVMFWLDPQLAAVMLIPFIGLASIVKIAARPTQKWSSVAQERMADLSVIAQENFSGIRIVKAFAKEAVSGNAFKQMGQAFLDANLRLATLRGTTSAAIHATKDLGVLCVLGLGGWHLVEGRIELGDFVVFLDVLTRALWPLIAIGWMLGMYTRAKSGAERLEEIFTVPPSVAELPEAVDPGPVTGRLSVSDLTYAWNGHDVLSEVSFDVPAGSVLGVTGRTGCGKTTLIKLLSRQVDPPARSVYLDGTDVRELPLERLRRTFGVVPQDAFLFSESIADNIGFAHEQLDDEALHGAARTARVHDDIEALEHGYDTLLGERGVTLSGGQRQRVTIARTLAADPPVLVLDDCLSAVDAVTERAILAELRDRLRGRTAVIVSHRVAALSLADRIVVLDEGRIVEQGSHDELLEHDGLYAEIEERQRIEAELEDL